MEHWTLDSANHQKTVALRRRISQQHKRTCAPSRKTRFVATDITDYRRRVRHNLQSDALRDKLTVSVR